MSWSSWSSGRTGKPGQRDRQDRQIWYLNLIFQAACVGQLSKLLQCFLLLPLPGAGWGKGYKVKKRDFMTSKNSFNYFIRYRLKRHLQSFERSAEMLLLLLLLRTIGLKVLENAICTFLKATMSLNFTCLSVSSLKSSVYISCRPPVICRAQFRGEEELKFADTTKFLKDQSTALAFPCLYIIHSLAHIIVWVAYPQGHWEETMRRSSKQKTNSSFKSYEIPITYLQILP